MILSKKVDLDDQNKINLTVFLTADERIKVKQSIELKDFYGDIIKLKFDLIRGEILKDNDILTNEQESFFVQIKAKPEPVITVKSDSFLDLIKTAYHLGNRHVNLEIGENYLRFSPDHVLEIMVRKLGLNLTEETVPFYPEMGAYKHSHK